MKLKIFILSLIALFFIYNAHSQVIIKELFPNNSEHWTGRISAIGFPPSIYKKKNGEIKAGVNSTLPPPTNAWVGWAIFDITSLPSNIEINSLSLNFYVNDPSNNDDISIIITSLTVFPPDPDIEGEEIWNDIIEGPFWANTGCGTVQGPCENVDLSNAIDQLKEYIDNGDGWWGVGFVIDPFDEHRCRIDGWDMTYVPHCVVEYEEIIPDPPTACFTTSPHPPEITAGQSVDFDGSCSTGEDLTYIWTFNGGDPGSAPNNPGPHEIFYYEEGTYPATLHVENSYGFDEYTVDVIVIPNPFPDVAVNNIWTAPAQINCSEEFEFHSAIQNCGSEDITDTITIYYQYKNENNNWINLNTSYIPGLPVGEEIEDFSNCELNEVEGLTSLRVNIEPVPGEVNIDNNILEGEWDVGNCSTVDSIQLNDDELYIYAMDFFPQPPGDIFTAEDAVSLNKIVNFSDKIEADKRPNQRKLEPSNDSSLIQIGNTGIYEGDFKLNFEQFGKKIHCNEFLDQNNKFLLAGLNVYIDRFEISYNDDYITVDGRLRLPELLGYYEYPINTLEINKNGISSIIGGLSSEKYSVGGGVFDIDVSFDYQESPLFKKFTGNGELSCEVSPISNFNIGTTIINGGIDSIGCDLEFLHGIPLGATGLKITVLRASVWGLVWEPLRLMAGLDLATTIGWIEIRDLNLTYTWKTSLSGEGHLYLFNSDVAYVGFLISKELLKFYGGVTIIPNHEFLIGYAEASLRKTGGVPYFRGRLTATLQIPDGDGFIYELLKCRIPLPYSLAHTDNYLTNTSIAGNFSLFEWKWHYKLEKEGSDFKAKFGRGWQSLSDKFCIYDSSNPLYLSFRDEILKGNGIPVISFNELENLNKSGNKYDFEYNLENETKALIIMIEDQNNIPNTVLTLPDSTQVTPENTCCGIDYYSNENESNAFYFCRYPITGTWNLSLIDATDNAIVKFKGAMDEPIINLSSGYKRSDNSVLIKWESRDTDDNARIDLYYDNDNTGANGYPILTDQPEDDHVKEFIWDVTDLPTGLYYIYGVISDTCHAPYISYLEDPIRIVNSNKFVYTPYDFNAEIQGDTAILLEWECNDPNSLLRYIVYYSNDINTLDYNSSHYSIGKKRSHPFMCFTPGKKYYFMVTAIDTLYNESDYSNIDSVTFISNVLNNSPNFNNIEFTDIIYTGDEFEHDLGCIDPDTPLSELIFELICMHGSDTVDNGAIISNEGIISWLTDLNDLGYYNIKAKVTDPQGLSDSVSFNLSVINPNNENKYIRINSPVYTCFGGNCFIEVNDKTLATSPEKIDNISIQVFTNADPDGTTLTAVETSPKSKVFTAVAELCEMKTRDDQIMVDTLDIIKSTYIREGDTLLDQCYFRHEPFTVSLQKEGDTIFCTGDSLNIILNTSSEDYTSYLWSDGETRTPQFAVSEPGKYWVSVSNKRGCIQNSDTLLIVPSPEPEPVLSQQDTLDVCINFELDPGEFPQCTFLWSNGSTTNSIQVTETGWYKVDVINPFGCIGSDSVYIEEVDLDPVADFNFTVLNSNLFLFNDASLYPDSYLWDFGDESTNSTEQNPEHQYEDGFYDCMLIVYNQCTQDTAIITIIASEVNEFQLPKILVQPNPTSGIISINISGRTQLGKISFSLMDIMGNTLWEQEENCSTEYSNYYDFSNLSKGIYVLKIQSQKWQVIKKIIRN